MTQYSCWATIIVPVYNVESWIGHCIKALFRQTVDMNKVEILLINDGSTDKSKSICEKYAKKYDNVKLYSKPNGGLSSTRNEGLRLARGKYVFYLDADDVFSDETIQNVCTFFDEHYDEIDEVTFPIVRYKNGHSLPLHYRYEFLNETGIYDLEEYPFISQTNINVCVKNKFEDNVMFETKSGFRHEDQLYNNTILREKMKIGFVKEAEYKYNRDNESSIVATYMYPYYIFETTMEYFESLFDSFDGPIPKYFQVMFINDLSWKLKEDKLYPFHYSDEEFERAINRIKALLARCDDESIIEHPSIDNFETQYWLSMKPNAHPVVIAEEDHFDIFVGDKSIYRRTFFEIVLHKLRVEKGKLRIIGFVKSPIYNYISKPCDVYVLKNDTDREKLDTFISVHSYHQCSFTQTNNFYAFDYECDVDEVKSIHFEVALSGHTYKTRFYFMPTSVFDPKHGVDEYIRDDVLLQVCDNRIMMSKVSSAQRDEIEKKATRMRHGDLKAVSLRNASLKYRTKHRVWLYYDLYSVKKDNGYYQFQNDFQHSKEDGIERYYVIFSNDNLDLFTSEQRKFLVRFGSPKHKLLYLSCERIFTAYFGFSTISPFKTEKNESRYADIIKFKTIYLQHGVLHAALHAYNAVERCRAEQIVVSSPFEVWNYTTNYNYREDDLIPVGMARYDFIDRTKEPTNRILFAPSWRKYLTIANTASSWTLHASKLLESDYFKGIIDFLTSPSLEQLLEKNDMVLDVKLHPVIAKDAHKFINISSKNIHVVAEEEVHVEDYKAFITDFSSYVFDFACLCRPILYFVTDFEQFKSGMNHYKDLDLDFDDAFGPLCKTPESAIEALTRIADSGFVAEKKYSDRMTSFYVPLDNCRERLYQYVMERDSE